MLQIAFGGAWVAGTMLRTARAAERGQLPLCRGRSCGSRHVGAGLNACCLPPRRGRRQAGGCSSGDGGAAEGRPMSASLAWPGAARRAACRGRRAARHKGGHALLGKHNRGEAEGTPGAARMFAPWEHNSGPKTCMLAGAQPRARQGRSAARAKAAQLPPAALDPRAGRKEVACAHACVAGRERAPGRGRAWGAPLRRANECGVMQGAVRKGAFRRVSRSGGGGSERAHAAQAGPLNSFNGQPWVNPVGFAAPRGARQEARAG
ncbi:MAG: hypothetical protein J3K34DRAFT_407222 [Monoraphidium minutum]|nr:MAG: hypothetical protein J3K34DRAFT_407222 [Monoraphidium minutum]